MAKTANLTALQIGSHFGTFVGAIYCLISSALIVALWMPGALWGLLLPAVLLIAMYTKIHRRRLVIGPEAGFFTTGLALSLFAALLNGVFTAVLIHMIGSWAVVQQMCRVCPLMAEMPGGLTARTLTITVTVVSFLAGSLLISPATALLAKVKMPQRSTRLR